MGEKTLMITGASTGIGRALALHFDNRGYKVFAGVRKDADAKSLSEEGSDRLTPVMVDVTDYESVDKVAGLINEEVGDAGLDGLINNAGIAVSGPLEFLPIKRFEDQIKVNVFGLVAVTQAFLPLLRKAKGRIVNIGSESGRFTMPFLAPYASSKHAVEAISDALRVELIPAGIKVVLIEPASIKTPIWEKSGAEAKTLIDEIPEQGREIYQKELAGSLKFVEIAAKNAIPVKRVVKAVDKAMTKSRPKVRYIVGAEAYLMAYGLNAMPRKIVDRVLSMGLRNIK